MTSPIAPFYGHEVQWIVALFITKPDLYKDYAEVKDRQGYFFDRFRKFAADYYHFSEDEGIYFASTRKDSAGEANICGGAGKSSAASSRYFKSRYRAVEESREKQVDRFAKKYGVSFEPGKDVRMFVGVTEIWNKLDRALDIIAVSKWSDVRERSYDDASFETPLPAKLDKLLVPFAIRNRALQKHRNITTTTMGATSCKIDVDREEMEYIRAKSEKIDATLPKISDSSYAKSVNPIEISPANPIVSAMVFVPPEIDDEW